MSLILEALRKSEAERRLGHAPDVLAAMPVLRTPTPRRQWPLVMAAALSLLAVSAAMWWWMHGAQSQPVANVVSTSQGAVSDAGAKAANVTSASAVQTSRDARTRRRVPVIALPPAAASRVDVPVRPATSSPYSPPAPSTAIERVQPIATFVNPTPAPIANPIAPAVPAPAAEPALLALADLSADERNGLPVLKVSMHVYADDPVHRFMIIDGQRVGEGARLADGVVLVRIRRDGAELDVRGRRLLLPKP